MSPSFEYLSEILNHSRRYLFSDSFSDLQELSPPGELQYCGPHFLAVIHYAVKSAPYHNETRFSDGLSNLEELAREHWFHPSKAAAQNLLNTMASFLSEVRVFFAVQKLHQCSSPNAPKTVDIMAGFIEFLVDALEKSSSPLCSWVIVPTQVNILCKRLTFLLAILRDTPFQCADLEEIENILVEIESVANEIGIFLCSFFFTTLHVTIPTMDLQLFALLSKLKAVKRKIKEQCIMVFKQQKSTTPGLTSASIFIVDSLLDDLSHLLNNKANLIVKVKDEITKLHDELYLSRSMLRDAELQRNKELSECEMQLIDLAYQAEYIIACFAAGEVPIWYLALRLPNFIQNHRLIRASLVEIKLNSGIRSIKLAETSAVVPSTQVVAKSVPMVDEIIVGFTGITTQIASQLIGGPDCLQIISIIGMGGLGKTTLARKLYNDSNILLHFDNRAWCAVSQLYQKTKLLTDILSSLSSFNKDEASVMEDHQLVDRVYKSLKGTRYLLVMDDIWEIEIWDDLKRYFPNDNNGSRVLFTGRNKDVALQASSEAFIHDLPLLRTDDCWDLLQKKVFPNSLCPLELQYVGKEIVRNCKGLPLAVVGIAAVLANMEQRESLWQEVATSLSSYLSRRQDILELSYEHLPSRLKPCFLYLGMFEEVDEIPVRKLLSLWVSEGFIPKNECKISEDVAEDYLLELINRSMVQVAKRRSDNGVKTCTIHDLIRDMCLRIAHKENFLMMTNEPVEAHIRSLWSDFSDLSLITSSMKRLRVLKLSKNFLGYDGTMLGFLVQLRHLECDARLSNFSGHMNLELLSISQLESDIMLNMPKLRHLYIGKFQAILKWDISQTNSLQTLYGIILEDLKDEERLRRFSHLRRLKCQYGESWLAQYEFDWFEGTISHECSGDFSSLNQLVSLKIHGNNKKFREINFPIYIKKLSLQFLNLTCRLLSSIGTLPNLEILKLYCLGFEKARWNTNDDEFQKLKFLKLHQVGLEEWIASDDHFPILERLVLRRCWRLTHLPSDLGYTPTLQRIEVLYCSAGLRNSAKHIREEQEEAGNEQLKVIISGNYNGR